MTKKKAKELAEAVEQEAEELEDLGWRFPMLYAAVIQLLEAHADQGKG